MAVAVPQAVTMLAAPGPTEEVATQICLRFICLAKATAAWAMPCSFWPCQISRCLASWLQSLAQPHHVAVTGDDEHAADEAALFAVHFDILVLKETDQSLRHGQTNGFHGVITSCQ